MTMNSQRRLTTNEMKRGERDDGRDDEGCVPACLSVYGLERGGQHSKGIIFSAHLERYLFHPKAMHKKKKKNVCLATAI
ncbi:unnamed protein product [Caenorhabditis bovis]|uniref:Uncharacterized protein n=1 Tax=Caenorhabditis bovis TaxID=2654633 RepID=A0A8S1EBW0_9PELO|nr:unnamed protein product [Caenorhabditis bovis]